ncbi:MAG: hypothetical protein ACFCUJ_08100 [Thiotrichales bacterium]
MRLKRVAQESKAQLGAVAVAAFVTTLYQATEGSATGLGGIARAAWGDTQTRIERLKASGDDWTEL